MHKHDCRHCGRDFVCDEPLDCFESVITCSECYWDHEIPLLVLFLVCGMVAIAALVIIFRIFGGH